MMTKKEIIDFVLNQPFPGNDKYPAKHPIWDSYQENCISPREAWTKKEFIEKAVDNIFYYLDYCKKNNKEPEFISRYSKALEHGGIELCKAVLYRFSVLKIAPKATAITKKQVLQAIRESNADISNGIYIPMAGFGGIAEAAEYLNVPFEAYDINQNLCTWYGWEKRDVLAQVVITEKTVVCCPPFDKKEQWKGTPEENYLSFDTWAELIQKHVIAPDYVLIGPTSKGIGTGLFSKKDRGQVLYKQYSFPRPEKRYIEKYYALMNYRKTHILENDFEVHHIQPKSFGGNDSEENLVRLTYLEHVKAHFYLMMICRNNKSLEAKMAKAVNFIVGKNYKLLFKNKKFKKIFQAQKSATREDMKKRWAGEWGIRQRAILNSPEVKVKHSRISKDRWQNPDYRARMCEINQRVRETAEYRTNLSNSVKKAMTPEVRKKISDTLKGKKTSDETRKKLSESLKGHKISEETKEKIRRALTGRHTKPCSEETKRKISEATKGKKGKPCSKEHKAILSAVHKGNLWWNNGVRNKRAKECPGPEWKRGKL